MSEKFRNRYRIRSARAPWWDYGWPAAYFITIVTKNRFPYFGEIKDEKMHLSNVGVIADLLWYEIKNHAHDCDLGEFVVMPDHIHGILILKRNGEPKSNHRLVKRTAMVETRHALSLPSPYVSPGTEWPYVSPGTESPYVSPGTEWPYVSPGTEWPYVSPGTEWSYVSPDLPSQNRFQNQGKNTISAIIGSFKSAVNKHANRLGYPFRWQPRFHDRIIRNAFELERKTCYIRDNVKNWNGSTIEGKNLNKR
jgi:REP element-mobilizing transposase RayT